MHPLIFILGILQTKLWPGRYAYLGLGIAFGVLTLVKTTSMMRNSNFKQILLRLYLLLSVEHLVLFLDSYITLPVVIKITMPVIVSQFLFEIYRLRKDEIKIDELYSQEDYFKLSFKICEYMSSKLYFRKLEHSIS